MIDSETCLTLAEAAARLPRLDGRRVHVSALWRWCRHGLRGVRLEYRRVGHRLVTSVEALERFASRLAELDDAEAAGRVAPSPRGGRRARGRTPRQREAAIERAERELREAGV